MGNGRRHETAISAGRNERRSSQLILSSSTSILQKKVDIFEWKTKFVEDLMRRNEFCNAREKNDRSGLVRTQGARVRTWAKFMERSQNNI
jgi:hypothetical protein